jgi:predicted ATPase
MSPLLTKSNFIIITGGPGMGKTSLVQHLSELGYQHVPETGRSIIQQQVTDGGDALPWQNRAAYAQLMFNKSLEDFFKLITASDRLPRALRTASSLCDDRNCQE